MDLVKIFSAVVVLTISTAAHVIAQKEPVYLHHANTFPQQMSWWGDRYLFPGFREGTITYVTGFSPQRNLRMNYNMYFGQVDMIDDLGDTVQIEPARTFKSVSIGNDVFLYHNKEGYMRLLLQGDVSLAERTVFILSDSRYVNGPRDEYFDVRGRPSGFDKFYTKSSLFYFVSAEGTVYPTSRAVLKKLFPEYRNSIHEFTRVWNINFTKEQDLRQVTDYCNAFRHIPAGGNAGLIVRANQRMSHALRDSVYRFPGFQQGVISFTDGRRRQYHSLNYNLVSGEIEAVEGGDTVGIKNSQFITGVSIDGTTYFKRPQGYVELLLSGRVSLGVVRTLVMSHSQVVAASKYGPANSYEARQAYLDQVSFDRMFTSKDEFYLFDGSGTLYSPSTGSLRRLFPHASGEIDEYVRTYDSDLQNEKSLKEMISYLAGITDR